MIKSSLNLFKVTVLTFLAIFVLTGCKPPKDDDQQVENKQAENNINNVVSNSSLSLTLKMFKAALNGEKINDSGQSAITIPTKIYPLSGSQATKTLNFLSEATIFPVGNANAADWFKYATKGDLTLSRDANGLTINGEITISDYYNKSAHTFVFSNVRIDDTLKVVGRILQDGKILKSAIILTNQVSDNLSSHFGEGWAEMQMPAINAALVKYPNLLKVDKGNVKFDSVELSNAEVDGLLVDYNKHKGEILDATIFGNSPGNGNADVRWTKIVNIPSDVSEKTIQIQSVIATNAARSTARYCNGHGSFKAGNYPAVSPVSWSADLASKAMVNSNRQVNQGQGHWTPEYQVAQNVFVLSSFSAITPIIGYQKPRLTNNAGRLSFTGHEGHCQNVMGKSHTEVGVAWLANGTHHLSFWTQNLK